MSESLASELLAQPETLSTDTNLVANSASGGMQESELLLMQIDRKDRKDGEQMSREEIRLTAMTTSAG